MLVEHISLPLVEFSSAPQSDVSLIGTSRVHHYIGIRFKICTLHIHNLGTRWSEQPLTEPSRGNGGHQHQHFFAKAHTLLCVEWNCIEELYSLRKQPRRRPRTSTCCSAHIFLLQECSAPFEKEVLNKVVPANYTLKCSWLLRRFHFIRTIYSDALLTCIVHSLLILNSRDAKRIRAQHLDLRHSITYILLVQGYICFVFSPLARARVVRDGREDFRITGACMLHTLHPARYIILR